jgi:N-formylglutamate amidohydrolase
VTRIETTRFEILAPPQWTAPVVFNSPHSGKELPPRLVAASRLSAGQLRASEDVLVDELFQGCLDAGAPLLRALVSRSYIDLNREPYELDPRMFREKLPGHMNVSSPRVASGLGTIPKTVGDGINIYPGPISLAEALRRLEEVYRPYHRTLNALLDEAHRAAGIVLLVDCHSMPSSAVQHHKTIRGSALDVVVGDRFGNACQAAFVELIEDHLVGAGLAVGRNKPYAGGFITECHGHPREGRHAVQIEINRALYFDERLRTPTLGYSELKSVLDKLTLKLADAVTSIAGQGPLAAAAE